MSNWISKNIKGKIINKEPKFKNGDIVLMKNNVKIFDNKNRPYMFFEKYGETFLLPITHNGLMNKFLKIEFNISDIHIFDLKLNTKHNIGYVLLNPISINKTNNYRVVGKIPSMILSKINKLYV
jgi:hypothetical protein